MKPMNTDPFSDFAVQYTPNRNQVTPDPSDPDYHAKVRELYPSLEAYSDSFWDTLDPGPDEVFVSGHLVSNHLKNFTENTIDIERYALFERNRRVGIRERIHLALGGAGASLGVYGTPFELADAALYAIERKYTPAAFSLIAALSPVPFPTGSIAARAAARVTGVIDTFRAAKQLRVAKVATATQKVGIQRAHNLLNQSANVPRQLPSYSIARQASTTINVSSSRSIVSQYDTLGLTRPRSVERALGGTSGHRFASEVLEGGSGRAFAGHGHFGADSGDLIVPDGTFITLPRKGARILDETGRYIERGDWDGLAAAAARNPRIARDIEGMATYLPGARIPNYTLTAPTKNSRNTHIFSLDNRRGFYSTFATIGTEHGAMPLGCMYGIEVIIMHFDDLTVYEYHLPFRLDGVLNVGWLDSKHPFRQGPIDSEFIDTLRALIIVVNATAFRFTLTKFGDSILVRCATCILESNADCAVTLTLEVLKSGFLLETKSLLRLQRYCTTSSTILTGHPMILFKP